MKYLKKYKNKVDLMGAVKRAASNEKFFSEESMKFFGRQKMSIEVWPDKSELVFKIQFLSKHPRVTYYEIDPITLKINTFSEGK